MIMMGFCKSVHSFLGLASPMNYLDATTCTGFHDKSSPAPNCKCLPGGGLALITATDDSLRTPNVLESATVKSLPPPFPLPSLKANKDPGGIGFIDDIGGGVNGLMSCTESLGFESCDERRVDDQIEMCSTTTTRSPISRWKKVSGRRRDVKTFPPPISSLNHNGHPSFFLLPNRKDGRLELTQVRIDRPEILRASRQDGRLRLHLITQEEEEEDDDDFELNEEEEEELEEELQEGEEEVVAVVVEEERVGEWSFPVTGEGFRRCNEVLTHHHNTHNLHVWSQHCVTTR